MDQADPTEADLESCKPPFMAKAAGGLVMLCGLFTALQAPQLWGFTLRGWFVVMPYLALALGVGCIYIGFTVMRFRGWALMAATMSTGLLVILGGLWVLVGFAHGFVSLLSMGLPVLYLAASVTSGLTISAALRADRARERLEASGMRLGV